MDLKPNTHRRRDSTRQLSRVGGVWALVSVVGFINRPKRVRVNGVFRPTTYVLQVYNAIQALSEDASL